MLNQNRKLLINKMQHRLIMFLFTSAVLIFLDLGVFSVSFIFGFFLIFSTISKNINLLIPHGLMWNLFAFLFIALLSMLFSELKISFFQVKVFIQSIYWFILAMIIYKLYPIINKKILSKYIFFSTVFLLVLYVAGFRVGMSQNSVAFSIIICAPIGYFFLKRQWQKIMFSLLLIFLMLLNGSRTGAIISIVQFGLLFILSTPKLHKYFKLIIFLFVTFILMFNIEQVRIGIGRVVMPYNEELGLLIQDPEYVMMNDLSWIQRKAQIQKGKQIFFEHPILGIGYLNFSSYDIVIDESKIMSDIPIKGIDNRSAHNSYVGLLAETGIIGFAVFILFLLSIMFRFWKNIDRIGGTFESYIFISFIGLLIYFFTISAFLGTSSWIMYGLFAGASFKLTKRNMKKNNINGTTKQSICINYQAAHSGDLTESLYEKHPLPRQ